jgi:PEP-CTERM motif
MRFPSTVAAASLALTAALIASPVQAAPILGSAGAGLQNASTPMENSSRYWDGNSWDSNGVVDGSGFNPCSAGSLANGVACGLNAAASGVAARAGLSGTSFGLANSGTGFDAWGNADGSADMNYGFGNADGGVFAFTMLGEFTDDWDVNEIGWYDVGNPQDRHTIFGADAAVGAQSQVFIPGNFGFYYLNTSGNGEMFYTQSMFNTLGATKQQFATFQQGDYTIMGVEDIFSNVLSRAWQPGTADYDYNDVMFGFRSVAQVPEPGTLLLVGMGLAGFAVQRRRKVSA